MARNSGYRANNVHVRGDNNGNDGLEVDSFTHLWDRGNAATQLTPRKQLRADGGVNANSRARLAVISEDIDLGGASSVLSTDGLLPANALIFQITCTPLIDFSTPTTYNVGDAVSNTRFATGLTNDNVSEGPKYAVAHLAVATLAMFQAASGKVKLTPNAAGTGRVRVSVTYLSVLGGLA